MEFGDAAGGAGGFGADAFGDGAFGDELSQLGPLQLGPLPPQPHALLPSSTLGPSLLGTGATLSFVFEDPDAGLGLSSLPSRAQSPPLDSEFELRGAKRPLSSMSDSGLPPSGDSVEGIDDFPSQQGGHLASSGVPAPGNRKQMRTGSASPSSATTPGARKFYCRFPMCGRGPYATTDGVRRHCRKQHLEWLTGLGSAPPKAFASTVASTPQQDIYAD